MRKLKRLVLVLLMLLIGAAPAHAVDRGFLQLSDAGLTGEFEALRPKLTETVNDLLRDRGLSPMTAEEIDLDAFYPYYYLEDPFSTEIETASDFHAMIAAQEGYMWCYSFAYEGQYLELTTAVGHPLRKDAADSLTEAQIAEIQANAGEWKFNSLGWGDAPIDRKADALALGAAGERITLIGGFHGLMFAVCTEGEEITEVIALEDARLAIYRPNLDEIMQKGGFETADGNSLVIRAGDRFSYAALQQSLGRLEETPLTGEYALQGGSAALALLGDRRVLIAVCGGLVAAVLLILHFRKKT